MKFLEGDYTFSLNSKDMHDNTLPLISSKANGGTMVLWKLQLDPFITIHPVPNSSFLPLVFQPPNLKPSIHISIYLPTSGQENEFLLALTELSLTLHHLHQKYPDFPCFLRGDFNVSKRNAKSMELLEAFKYDEDLIEIDIQHPTYHHFLGSGASDSHLDKILVSKNALKADILLDILCKLEEPLIDLHHDIILSSFDLGVTEFTDEYCRVKSVVPEIPNTRHKIQWSDEGVHLYQSLVLPLLSSLLENWSSAPSRTNVSLLMETSADILTTAAQKSNKCFPLNSRIPPRSHATPRHIKLSKKNVLKAWNELKTLRRNESASPEQLNDATVAYKNMKNSHRQLLRRHRAQMSIKRDESLLTNPSKTYSRIKQAKRSSCSKVNKLTVGCDTYHDEFVKDGFYHSVAALKKRNVEKLNSSQHFCDLTSEYMHIVELCRKGTSLPVITDEDALEILTRMKPNVPDINSVTPNHFLLAGPLGWRLFALLLNSLIADISFTNMPQINTAYACVLHKGHGKDKTSSKSYRTISSCPVLAKALDMHVRDLHLKEWNKDQSNVQFQGEGSSHEFAALLLTECVLFSTLTDKLPLFVLYLDAQSAFDVVQREILIRNLYHTQQDDQSIIYIDNRLSSRETVVDWDGHLMGPIHDEQGLEQGGQSSSDFYKIYGKEQLSMAQRSGLGLKLGNLMVSAVGQADDTILLSQDLVKLHYQLHLTNIYCGKHFVDLSAEKTTLQVFTPTKSDFDL